MRAAVFLAALLAFAAQAGEERVHTLLGEPRAAARYLEPGRWPN